MQSRRLLHQARAVRAAAHHIAVAEVAVAAARHRTEAVVAVHLAPTLRHLRAQASVAEVAHHTHREATRVADSFFNDKNAEL